MFSFFFFLYSLEAIKKYQKYARCFNQLDCRYFTFYIMYVSKKSKKSCIWSKKSCIFILDVMLRNPCFYVFGDAFRVLHFFCTHFQAIFSFNKIFDQQTFNTILKLTGAYILSLKVNSNVSMVKLNSHKTVKYLCN